ncbi:protein Niban 2-like [Solea solea]|uniref:protein Niban 2-like n=1 Tax=Solea solea TaxID=90069 RepID=UPI00272A8DFF|nr:protein Niban 2-like [Solea solea]
MLKNVEHMEKISMLAFHPVKMHSCYEKVVNLSLEGLQQQFDVSSPSVFVQRAQIPMREVKPQLLTNQSNIGYWLTG